MFFLNGARINLDTMDCNISSSNKNISGKPQSLFFMENGILQEKRFADATIKMSLLLIKNDDKYSCVIADRQFNESILFRLYYLGGEGLRFIKKFSAAEDLRSRTRIYAYKIEWDSYLLDK